jgi:hypothetical protein
MNKLLFLVASLVTFASPSAHADRGCRRGAPLISAVHNHGMDVGPGGIEIETTGAWHIYHHDPKAMDQLDARGCITEKELAELKEALAKAPWQITRSGVACDALGVGSTDWTYGKHTFSQMMCGRDTIDVATQKAFALVDKLEQEYTPKKQR